jgi:hypothetical protein
MNRLYELFKKPSGPSTGKALLNHIIFSPSQTGETAPLTYVNKLGVCTLARNRKHAHGCHKRLTWETRDKVGRTSWNGKRESEVERGRGKWKREVEVGTGGGEGIGKAMWKVEPRRVRGKKSMKGRGTLKWDGEVGRARGERKREAKGKAEVRREAGKGVGVHLFRK